MRQAGELAIATKRHMRAELKADGSWVTDADKGVEAFFREKLPQLLPGSSVWGEEEGYTEPGPNGLWALDPIDGTSNYRFGSPQWGISLGLVQGNAVVLGAIYLPDQDKLYAGGPGLGVTLNGTPLDPLKPGVIHPEELVSYGDLTLTKYNGQLPGKMRYQGAFVADSAMVLEGVYRAMLSDKAALYDAAASFAMAIELGADVRYADGSNVDIVELLNVRPFPKPIGILPPESGFYLK